MSRYDPLNKALTGFRRREVSSRSGSVPNIMDGTHRRSYDDPPPTALHAQHLSHTLYSALLQPDTYDPIAAEYHDGTPNYGPPDPWTESEWTPPPPLHPPPTVGIDEDPEPGPTYEDGIIAQELIEHVLIERAAAEADFLRLREPIPIGHTDECEPPGAGVESAIEVSPYQDDVPPGTGGHFNAPPEDEPLEPHVFDALTEAIQSFEQPLGDTPGALESPIPEQHQYDMPLEDVVGQEMHPFEDPYRIMNPYELTAPLETPGLMPPGLGPMGPGMGPLW